MEERTTGQRFTDWVRSRLIRNQLQFEPPTRKNPEINDQIRAIANRGRVVESIDTLFPRHSPLQAEYWERRLREEGER